VGRLLARPELPDAIRRAAGEREAARVGLGKSRAEVWRLTARGRPALYLKVQSARAAPSLRGERDRLLWIAGRLPVPEVVAWAEREGHEYLLLSAVPGEPASDAATGAAARRVAALVGAALRRVHALPAAGCPFDASNETLIAAAKRNVERGAVDAEDFDPERRGRSPADVLVDVRRARPRAPGPSVFLHGDASFPNFLVVRRTLGGVVDWGMAGTGDPYRDLALALRSLGWNHGPRWTDELVAGYGLDALDASRVAFHAMLDELF
jgi:aminoglycoside phosphotransferase